MSAGTANQRHPWQRSEDFPVLSLQYLEGKLGTLRKALMDLAAQVAAEDSKDTSSYRIDPIHVDQALQRLLQNISAYEGDLGVTL